MQFLLVVALAAAAAASPQQQQQQRQYQRDYERYQQQVAAQRAAAVAQQQQQPGYNPQTAPVVSRNEVHDEANQYSYQYDTVDGQHFQENGALKSTPAGDDYVLVKQGSYSYYPPGSQTPVQISYTADENGFQPQGNVLPQSPAAPAPQTF